MTKNSEREQDTYLVHFGVKGMKWGVRKQRPISQGKQRRLKEKQNYKLVKKRLKETGTNVNSLQNYERGGISNKKVKKKLGTDIKVSQVSDYMKRREKKAYKAIAGFTAVSMAAAMAYSKTH